MTTATLAILGPEDRDLRPTVLVEYDGPQLVLFHGPPMRVGMVLEPGSTTETWFLARTSRLELEALASGSFPMRDVFTRKDQLQGLDIVYPWRAVRAFDVALSEVPRKILPVPGAPLPTLSMEVLRQAIGIPTETRAECRVRFGGMPVHDTSIEFGALGKLAQTIQMLWTAIADRLSDSRALDTVLPPATILAGPASHGSFAIELRGTNEALFGKVVAEYGRLMSLAFNDEAKLLRELKEHRLLQKRMRQYLRAIEDLNVDALVETPTLSVFVGHAVPAATRASLRIPTAPPEPRAKSPKEQISRRGYFDEFGVDRRTFSFYDIDSSERIAGKLSGEIARDVATRGTVEAAVGRITRYRAEFSVTGSRYTLTAFAREQRELFEPD